MRDLAKSILGLSWAVSVFSAQQLSKVLAQASTETPESAVAQIDEVTRAVRSHLSEAMAQQFRMGDEWQRRLVDAMFDAATVDALDPRHALRTGMDLIQRSVDTVRRASPTKPAAGRAAVA